MAELTLTTYTSSSPEIKYLDRGLILIGIPLINVLNYYLTYSNIQVDAYTFITFTLDTFEGYAAWYAGRAAVLMFDKYYPWEKFGWRRLLAQVPIVSVVVLAVISILTEIVNAIVTDKPVPLDFYTHDIFLFLIWSFFLNGVYLGIYLYQKVTKLKEDSKTQPKENSATTEQPFIITKSGNTQKLLYLYEVKCFYIEHDYVRCITAQGSHIINDYTLEKLESLLDPAHFYRANRQCIITREVVDQVSREKDGKLMLFLHTTTGLPLNITVSRLRATAFKQWLHDSSVN